MSKSSKSSTPKDDTLIYFHKDETTDKDTKSSSTVEKMVRHSDTGIFMKFFENKNDKKKRVTVKSEKSGEYVVSIKDGNNDPKTSTHDKKGLLAFLKERKELDFMLTYVSKEKTLSRPSSKKSSKTKKASKTKKSKKVSKKL